MPKSNNNTVPQPERLSKSKRSSNMSLPDRATPLGMAPTVSRRNTINEENPSKPRKKVKAPSTPTIPEDPTAEQLDVRTAFVIENETRKLNRSSSSASKMSTTSGKSTKVTYTYDNKAYDENLKRTNSQDTSTRTASRPPSVQSLEIYREQYCCCAKRTKCERSLLVTVSVLIIIVIVLVIVIAVLAKNNKLKTLFTNIV